ncbi:hypothetical protein AwPolaro_11140 [Polaromonas sp.]|nr:hypothetical protein AwPolaro_11140 [Polaromonas sp.]
MGISDRRYCFYTEIVALRPHAVAQDDKAKVGKHDWAVLRGPLVAALDSVADALGDAREMVLEAIDSHMQGFFEQALQLQLSALRMDLRCGFAGK